MRVKSNRVRLAAAAAVAAASDTEPVDPEVAAVVSAVPPAVTVKARAVATPMAATTSVAIRIRAISFIRPMSARSLHTGWMITGRIRPHLFADQQPDQQIQGDFAQIDSL